MIFSLIAGLVGDLELSEMVAKLEYYSQMRAMCKNVVKETTFWSLLRDIELTCLMADEANDYSWKKKV